MTVYDLAPSTMILVSEAELRDNGMNPEFLTYTQTLGFLRSALKDSNVLLPECAGLRIFQNGSGILLFLFPPCSPDSLSMVNSGLIYA